ncbi:hypothetical protein [Micromonospora sediminicola]
MGGQQSAVPGADVRRGTVTYDHKAREWVADHSSAANKPLRPFGSKGSSR